MSDARLTREGLRDAQRAREALPGEKGGRHRRRGRRGGGTPATERFRSYYGKPIIKRPGWRPLDIAGYLFLGGLAGASAVLAAAAHATGRDRLARAGKVGAAGAISLSAAALIHDLGRPERFVYMLRVFKPTSPMSVGSWLLTVFAPAAGIAAVTDVTGRCPRLGGLATAGAAITGPAIVTYTAVLLCDTAVPAWHEGYREMPFVFTGSAMAAAGGLGMLAAPAEQTDLARGAAAVGTALELTAMTRMRRRLGPLAEPYHQGRANLLMRASEALMATGALAGLAAGGRSRRGAMASGAALIASSACTRFGVFEAGLISVADPKYTVMAQRADPGPPAGPGSRPSP
ncbi:NrfD/PsrC family molybdoenzyme membrane anchor subunit [Actinomadura sp. HBU206391]|uniref:NrfD/PsrC family molybdoenzyme membrane anchor subunit n=1 Tax=Actinomadura sp. HBU206391 TaxID=2731692 RepID=UPI00164F783F|nr:NrfD/PsrC family molybdoenzyme membrane anchor subunit [Actinomadura sp. HBU206391]MBC6459432.1 polysulfide reductase NrfD [Actinomadura sp. HBU206391]